MGSVLSNIECPTCKSEECYNDYHYKTGEEVINCPECGYHYSYFYKRDDNGNYLKKDNTKGYEFSNLILEENEIKHPFCVYKIKFKDNVREVCLLETEKDYLEFCENLKTFDMGAIKSVAISRFTDGVIKKEVLYGDV